VESYRTVRGSRQRIVATIGKLPGLDKEERMGWEEIRRILDGKPRPEPGLFEGYEEPPLWATVNINQVSVERLRNLGDVYLALLLWNRLGFAEFCKEYLPVGREDISWSVMVCILVLARFCAPSSEWQIAESWYDKTALDDLLGVACEKVNEEVQPGVQVRLCPSPEDKVETFVLCRSQGRREKENAILKRFVGNMETALARMAARMETGRLKDRQKAERQIGRLQERNGRAASLSRLNEVECLALSFSPATVWKSSRIN